MSGSRVTRPATTPSPGDVGRLVAAVEQHLHADADAEERPPVGRRFLRHRLETATRASARMHAPNAPTPGSTTASAAAIASASAVSVASAPRCCSAFSADRRFPIP